MSDWETSNTHVKSEKNMYRNWLKAAAITIFLAWGGRAIAQDPEEFERWSERCYALAGEEALVACEKAIDLNQQHAEVWMNRGAILLELGELQESLLSYERALEIEPDYSAALASRCAALGRLDRFEESLTSCNLALRGDGRWGSDSAALGWTNRGATLLRMGEYELALSSFNQALRVDPNYEKAWEGWWLVRKFLEASS